MEYSNLFYVTICVTSAFVMFIMPLGVALTEHITSSSTLAELNAVEWKTAAETPLPLSQMSLPFITTYPSPRNPLVPATNTAGAPMTPAHLAAVDFHTHTTDSECTNLRENIEWHVAMGFKVVAISDHDEFADPATFPAEQKYWEEKGVVVIPAIELTTNCAHMICMNVYKNDLPSSFLDSPGSSTATALPVMASAVKHCHAAGGLVQWAHPQWTEDRLNKSCVVHFDEVYEHDNEAYVDFVEIVNSYNWDQEHRVDALAVKQLESFCAQHPDACPRAIAASDMHHPYVAGVRLSGASFIDTSNLTEFTATSVMQLLADSSSPMYTAPLAHGILAIPPATWATSSDMRRFAQYADRSETYPLLSRYGSFVLMGFVLMLIIGFVVLLAFGAVLLVKKLLNKTKNGGKAAVATESPETYITQDIV